MLAVDGWHLGRLCVVRAMGMLRPILATQPVVKSGIEPLTNKYQTVPNISHNTA
jgi:hypothetical protein